MMTVFNSVGIPCQRLKWSTKPMNKQRSYWLKLSQRGFWIGLTFIHLASEMEARQFYQQVVGSSFGCSDSQ